MNKVISIVHEYRLTITWAISTFMVAGGTAITTKSIGLGFIVIGVLWAMPTSVAIILGYIDE